MVHSTQGAVGSMRFSFWQLTVVSEIMARSVAGIISFFIIVFLYLIYMSFIVFATIAVLCALFSVWKMQMAIIWGEMTKRLQSTTTDGFTCI